MADSANSMISSRRAILAGIPVAIGVGVLLPPAAVAAPALDPIFAKIETHERCERDFADASRRTDEISARRDGRRITDEDEARRAAANEASHAAWTDLIDTTPTTTAGIGALLSYVRGLDGWAYCHGYDYDLLSDAIGTALRALA